MKPAFPIPADVIRVQIEASDPDVSAWVSANAGSGKTHVLAQRVIRLMLAGCDPAKILCLTYTKAAAANMANRVFGTLAAWTALDDDALDAEIAKIDGRAPDPQRRLRARRLFARALDTPGGLKVQTIHAFCTRLLHQFPFEADVAAPFAVLEEATESELIDRLRLEVLLEAAAAPDSALGRALATAIPAAADSTFADIVREAMRERDAIFAWIEADGGIEGAIAALGRTLGLEPHDTLGSVERDMMDGPLLPLSEWEAVAATLALGSTNDRKQAERLRNALATDGAERLDCYLDVFFTEKGLRQRLATQAIDKIAPDLGPRLQAEQERLGPLCARRHAVAARDRTAALLTIATAVIARYRREKDRRGLLDYDDLIDKTLGLLDNVAAAWVHYKLDLGIDHVLIDEAQDTSPKQWQIVKRLVSEFTAGEGARGARRTIFAVGDEKQSIFSFQDAAPHEFAAMRRHFRRAHEDGDLIFRDLRFSYSFRSAPDVLGAVDTVFSRSEAYRGLADDPVPTVHQAVRAQAPGVVEIWPLIEASERRTIEGWDAPFDELTETSPVVRLARRIATTVRLQIARGETVAATGRPMRAGDVLILVRQRGALFEAIIRALKDERVPVAGADRLVLTEHIAIMDLMALADALLLPADDLALATVLKSPLFGFDDDQLFTLAHNRRGTLRAALAARAGDDPRFAEADGELAALAQAARHDTPFAFYARLLGAGGRRRRILARLGIEAADALDEFLALALDYERRETPSLQGFVAWLRASCADVKRDMEMGRDEVRVMTAHGAKGLEAPIVILADTTTRPAGPRDPRLLRLPAGGGLPDRLVWIGRKDTDPPAVAAAREAARRAAEDEHRRLLYVAMTRAEDRLIVCGAQGRNKRPDGCWYDLVHDALAPGAVAEPAIDGDGEVLCWRKNPPRPASVSAPETSAPAPDTTLPDWLARPAPREAPPVLAVQPSGAEDGIAAGSGGGRADALRRGVLVHRLLQVLPDLQPEQRQAAAARYLERAGADLDAAVRAGLAAQVLALLADPAFRLLFAPGSRAEVPIVGRLARGAAQPALHVSGQVDRLVITPEFVLIADYKSNRPPPRELADVPANYVAQLALYRAVLRKLYPDRAVRAALIWTEVPDLMELPAAALDAAGLRLGI